MEIRTRLWLATGGVSVVAGLGEPCRLAGTTSRSPSVTYICSLGHNRTQTRRATTALLPRQTQRIALLRCLREHHNDLPHCALDLYLHLEYRYREFNAKGLVEIEGLGDFC